MASSKLMETKDGKRFWKISVSRGRGNIPFTERFYWQDGWSKRFAEQQLRGEISRFESECKAGNVLTREQQKEKKEREEREALELAREKELQEKLIQTVRKYAEETFLPAKEIECKEHTRAYYANALNKHILPELGEYRLPDVTSALLQEFLLKKQKENYSHSTLLGIHVTLNQIFKMAYMAEVIDRNPVDRVPRPRKPKGEIKSSEVEAYTASEIKNILDKLSKEPLKWQVMIRLMIDTGIRRGEACGLKWKSVDFENSRITIENNLCYTKEKGIYDELPKNSQVRTISVSPVVMDYLKKLQKQQKEDAKKRMNRLEKERKPLDIKKITASEYVFTEKGYNDPMHPQSPTRYFSKFGKKYGIEKFHPHKLRHSFASVAITSGADIASVSKILGHAEISTTLKTYTHASEESMKRASDVFRNAIGEIKKAE